jgi:hypothetical protein
MTDSMQSTRRASRAWSVATAFLLVAGPNALARGTIVVLALCTSQTAARAARSYRLCCPRRWGVTTRIAVSHHRDRPAFGRPGYSARPNKVSERPPSYGEPRRDTEASWRSDGCWRSTIARLYCVVTLTRQREQHISLPSPRTAPRRTNQSNAGQIWSWLKTSPRRSVIPWADLRIAAREQPTNCSAEFRAVPYTFAKVNRRSYPQNAPRPCGPHNSTDAIFTRHAGQVPAHRRGE